MPASCASIPATVGTWYLARLRRTDEGRSARSGLRDPSAAADRRQAEASAAGRRASDARLGARPRARARRGGRRPSRHEQPLRSELRGVGGERATSRSTTTGRRRTTTGSARSATSSSWSTPPASRARSCSSSPATTSSSCRCRSSPPGGGTSPSRRAPYRCMTSATSSSPRITGSRRPTETAASSSSSRSRVSRRRRSPRPLIYLLPPEHVALIGTYLAEGHSPDNAGNFLGWLADREPVYGYPFLSGWHDIGSHSQLLEADNWLRARPACPSARRTASTELRRFRHTCALSVGTCSTCSCRSAASSAARTEPALRRVSRRPAVARAAALRALRRSGGVAGRPLPRVRGQRIAFATARAAVATTSGSPLRPRLEGARAAAARDRSGAQLVVERLPPPDADAVTFVPADRDRRRTRPQSRRAPGPRARTPLGAPVRAAPRARARRPAARRHGHGAPQRPRRVPRDRRPRRAASRSSTTSTRPARPCPPRPRRCAPPAHAESRS